MIMACLLLCQPSHSTWQHGKSCCPYLTRTQGQTETRMILSSGTVYLIAVHHTRLQQPSGWMQQSVSAVKSEPGYLYMISLQNGGYTCVGIPRPCRSLPEQRGGRHQLDALRAGLPPLSGGCPAGLHAPCPQLPECISG